MIYALMTFDRMGCQLFGSSLLMPEHPLVLGAAGGSAASFLFSLVRQVLFEDPLAVHNILPGVKDCICDTLDLEISDRKTAQIFIAGLLCGVLLGPLIDIVWILRQRWRRYVWAGVTSGVQPPPRSLYKVI